MTMKNKIILGLGSLAVAGLALVGWMDLRHLAVEANTRPARPSETAETTDDERRHEDRKDRLDGPSDRGLVGTLSAIDATSLTLEVSGGRMAGGSSAADTQTGATQNKAASSSGTSTSPSSSLQFQLADAVLFVDDSGNTLDAIESGQKVRLSLNEVNQVNQITLIQVDDAQ